MEDTLLDEEFPVVLLEFNELDEDEEVDSEDLELSLLESKLHELELLTEELELLTEELDKSGLSTVLSEELLDTGEIMECRISE